MSVFHVIEGGELKKVELAVYADYECLPEDLLEVWSFRCGYRNTPAVRKEGHAEDTDAPK